MLQFNMIVILLLLQVFSLQIIKASIIYYEVQLLGKVSLTSTTTIYLRVESNLVTGVYSSTSDFNLNANNYIIGVGVYDANDNQFDYITGAPTYGITGQGISFKLNGIYKNLYYYSVSKSLVLSSQDPSTLNGPVTIAVTTIPTNYYKLTIAATPIITVYITVVSTYVTGVYTSLNNVNTPALNTILAPFTFDGNDNTFDYNMYNFGGISFIYQQTQCTIFYASTLQFLSYPIFPGPVLVTATPLPIQYYTLSISTTPMRVIYLSVVDNIVIGVYTSLSDLKSITDNLVVPVGSYKNNDNIYDYTTAASPYALTYGGISFILDNTLTNVFYNPYVYPSLFLYFSDPLGMVFFTVPVTATTAAISLTSAPTSTPTALPSKAPTYQPTHTPSKQPSRAPTKAPSKSPTKQPTHTPTAAPTA